MCITNGSVYFINFQFKKANCFGLGATLVLLLGHLQYTTASSLQTGQWRSKQEVGRCRRKCFLMNLLNLIMKIDSIGGYTGTIALYINFPTG